MIRELMRTVWERFDNWHCATLTREMTSSFAEWGEESELAYPFDIRGVGFIHAGKRVFIGPRVLMGAREGAEIHLGDDVMLGPEVRIIAGDHRYDLPGKTIRESGEGNYMPIIIGKGAWIGCGAVLLKGVTVGEGAIVGAGSVVTHDVPPFEIHAGNPATLRKHRFDADAVH